MIARLGRHEPTIRPILPSIWTNAVHIAMLVDTSNKLTQGRSEHPTFRSFSVNCSVNMLYAKGHGSPKTQGSKISATKACPTASHRDTSPLPSVHLMTLTMIRLNPTSLSVTIDEVNNLVIRGTHGSSSDDSEVQTDEQTNKRTSKQRIFGRPEEQPPHAASQALASPAAASTKDGHLDAAPLQTHIDVETNDSHMEDVSQPAQALTATRTREDKNLNNQPASNDEVDLVFNRGGGGSADDADVNMTTPQQHGRTLAQGTFSRDDAPSQPGSSSDIVSPRWLSLPPRRPHPAWAAAEREITTSPLANRVPR